MEDFNHDNQKVEAALHGLAEQTAGKADASTVNSLTAQVSKKAEKTALAADVAALRAENLWVKLGEATLTKAAAELSVTVPNAELYDYFYCQYRTAGPRELQFFSANWTNAILSLTDPAIQVVGTAEVIRCSKAGALFRTEGMSNDGEYSRSISKKAMTDNFDPSGSAIFKLVSKDANLAAGSRLLLYGLKK